MIHYSFMLVEHITDEKSASDLIVSKIKHKVSNSELISLLRKYGVVDDMEPCSFHWYTQVREHSFLYNAVVFDCFENTELLLKIGYTFNLPDSAENAIAFIFALSTNRAINFISYAKLFKNYWPYMFTDKQAVYNLLGYTLFHLCNHGNNKGADFFLYLFEVCNPIAVDTACSGYTDHPLLTVAICAHSRMDIVRKILMKASADVLFADLECECFMNPLYEAFESNNKDCIELLWDLYPDKYRKQLLT